MKNLITYLKTLWRRVADSQSTDVSFDCRLTVGSPSGLDAKWKQNPFMRFAVVLTLIFTIGSGNVWGAAATLPVNYSFGDGKSSLPTGVTQNGLGSDYAVGNAPYRLRFDNNGDYIQIQVDAAAAAITIGIKEFGTSGASIQIQGSVDGSSFTNIQTLSFSQGQNKTSSQSTSNSISSSYRYFRVRRNSGSNFGLGTLAITKAAASCTKIGAPTVTATPGDGRIDLSWSNQTGASSYTVTKTPSGGSVGTPSKSGSTWSCAITGLTNGTTYTWSVEAVGSGDYCASGNTAASASATPNVYYTVTWMNNGSSYTTTSVASGQKPTFPDNPSSCDGTSTTFVGWTPTPWSGKLDDVSAKTIYTSGSAMPNVGGAVTYHAVFAKGTANTYKKGTKDDLTDGQTVLIVNPDASYAMSSNNGSSSGRLAAVSVTISANKITKNDATLLWTVETSSSNYKFKQGTKYLWANSSNNQLYASSSYEDEWSVTAQSSHYIIHNVSVNKDLEYYSPNFTTYNTGTGVAYQMDFYIPDYSQYLTTCCTDPGLAYGTASVTKTYGVSAFTNPLTNSHSVGVTYDSSDKTVATVDSEGEVTILKAGSTTITASSVAQTVAAVSYCADEASYTLTVNKADISPTLSYESGTLVIGNNSSSPTVGGNSGSGTVTYAITTESTSGVVTLNTSTGVVTAAKEGTATITATIPATTNYNGGSATANFTVTCGAPSSVDISGNYQFYPGETISLTATPTGGAGTPVTYQWKKGGSPIAGATSATYTKNNATASDAGAYTCTVQYGSNCATTSDAFNLKCMQFYLKNNSGEDISNHALTKVDATHATLSLSLTGGTTYKFRVTDGCGDWYGNTGEMTSSNCTNWAMDADADCRVTTSSKSATYVFNFDFSGGLLGSEMKVSVVYPSSNQASGKVIYWDNEVNKWNGSKLWYRIGKNNHNANTQLSKVAGTANFYSVTTSQYDGFEYWHIANNQGQGTGNIFWTKDNSGSGLEITNAMGFEGAPVTDATVTVTPTTTHSTGGSSDNNNCEFYTYSITSGVKSYTVTSSATNCTVAMEKYNNDAGSSTTALASGGTVMPTQYVKVTVTPNTGYQFSSVSVTNGTTVTAAAAGTPGVYYITGNATVTATCTVKSCTVNFDKNSGTGGDASTTATYGSAMTTVTAPTRTGYTFDGYWDAETDNDGSGTQYYLANGTSARDWDKDVTAAQTLYAKWNAKQYTIELDREGASTGAESVTATYDAGTLAGWSAPSKTGYTFGGYWSGDNGTGTLVISTTGVLQNSVTIEAVNWTDASGHWIKDGGVTVYAKWTAEQYTITYKDQGNVAYSGSNGGSLPTTHTYGAVTALVDGVKSGYRFDGWFDNSGCTGSAITTIGGTDITANTTYYAKWTQVYTVTWHVNGSVYNTGVVSGNSQVISGGKISDMPTAPADNTLSACANKFMGWSKKDAGATAKTTSYYDDLFTTVAGSPTISAATDFYAVFAEVTEDKYWSMGTIDKLGSGTGYAAYDGTHTVTGSDGNSYTYESSYVMSNSGNQFKASSDCGRIYNTSSLGNINRIVLNYSAYKGQMKVYESDSQISSSGTTALTETVSGEDNEIYTYECSGKGYFIVIQEGSNAAKADVTVYFGSSASNYRTQCDANMIRVTYDANGGMTGCENETTDKREDYTVCSTPPTRDYYTFAGWLCSADSKTYAASATIPAAAIDADFTLTAQWTPVPYSITYELYGGTNSGSNPATYNVTTATITLQDPTKGHDRFDGWYDNGSFTGDAITSIPLGSHGNITLYAKWTERHEIVFDADGTKTTIYRADDENMEDAVAGQGSVPSDPSAPTACSSKVFVGWSESTIDGETDDEPADLMKPAAGTVDEDKHYYAVWATRSSESGTHDLVDDDFNVTGTSEVTSRSGWTGLSTVYGGSGSIRFSSGGNAGTMTLVKTGLNFGTLVTSATITFKIKKYGSDGSGVLQISSNFEDATTTFSKDGGKTTGSSASYSTTDGSNWTTCTCTVGSISASTDIILEGQKNARVNVKDFLITYTGTMYSYSAYSTSCCATKVTLSQNSPEHGTIVFGKTSVGTCGDKEVSLTITPAAGYQLHSYEVATGSGKVATKSVSPDIALDNNSSAVQNITLTFADEANGAYDVTASFSLMTVTSWTWTMHDGGGAIPDPLNLYVGQSARLDVAYTPAGVDASKKTYTRNKDNAYINWVGSAYAGYSTISGRATTGENTTAVTFTHADGPTKTVNVKVLPLPLTHFVDLVHGKAFADVAATIVENALSATKTTPTSDDWTTPNANSCEENHLHLVGWIREDWPALVAYLNGTGDAPTTTAIVGAGNDGAGHAYFFAPNASINVQTFNGVTFYAVWSKVE